MDMAVSAMLDMLALVMLDMLAILMPMVPTPMPMVLTTLERGRLRLNPRLMLMPLFSMVPMVMLFLMLDTVPMLDTPMPMVPTPTPMVATVPTWDKKFSFSPSFAQFNHNRISNYLFKKAQQDKSK